MRIAMWSGPRNISTAMMYSFAARGDCAVVDEPFYAAYLHATGLDHPMRDEIIASQPTDPAKVIEGLLGPTPNGQPVAYHKHMTQHMIPEMPRDWITAFTNVFLIRHPARVIASYAAKRENPTLEDIGFPQQVELFELVKTSGQTPIVIDSADIRKNARKMIQALCETIGLSFTDTMMTWPAGGHPADGVWAKHWYGAVWKSTGFADSEGELPEVPASLRPVLDEAMPIYEEMRKNSL